MTCVEQSTNGAPQSRSQTGQQEPSRRRATTGQRSCVRPLWQGGGLITRKHCLNYELAWRSSSVQTGSSASAECVACRSRRTVAAGSCRATPSPRLSSAVGTARHPSIKGLLSLDASAVTCFLCSPAFSAKGRKAGGKEVWNVGKNQIFLGGGVTIFLAWLLHCFQLKHLQKDFINGNHCNKGNIKCLPLACNSCNCLIYPRLNKRLCLHQNSHFNNIDRILKEVRTVPLIIKCLCLTRGPQTTKPHRQRQANEKLLF